MNTFLKSFYLAATLIFASTLWVAPQAQADARDVKNLIESLEVGEPVYYENLTIIPVYNTRIKDQTSYTTLEEALKRNWLKVTEVGSGGNVPKLRISNRSSKYIYIMGGEILSGGKQDRLVGRDVLIRPKSKNIIVPVYCTEQGRWQKQTDNFYSKKNLGTWNLRANAQYAPSGAQGAIWNDIAKSAEKTNVSSRTNAFQSMYEDKTIRRKIADHEQHLQRIPELSNDTIGVVIAVSGEIVSVDLFANSKIFLKLWPKILKSSALSAISSDSYNGSVDEQDAVRFLRRIHDARFTEKSAIDLGTELSAYNNNVNANALVYRNTVLHLAAFPAEHREFSFKGNRDTDRRVPVMRR